MKGITRGKVAHVAEVIASDNVQEHLHGLHKKKFLRAVELESTNVSVVTQVAFVAGVLQVTVEDVALPSAVALTEEYAVVDVLFPADGDIVE